MRKDRECRVHAEFYLWLKELAEKNGTSMVKMSKEVAKDHKELQYYLAEKKKKTGEPMFSLRI